MQSNSLKQYTDLYEQHGHDLREGSPEAMNSLRRHAHEFLTGAGTSLPRRGQDGYAHTDLNAMFAPDYGVNIGRLAFRADLPSAFRCGVPNVSSLMGVVANDIFGPGEAMAKRLPEGVTVTTLRRAALTMPEVLEHYYGTVAPADNPAVALNNMLAQDGVLVHIARGVRLPQPVQLIEILGGVTSPLLALRRLLVVLEAGAECRLLVCDHSAPADDVDGHPVRMASDTVVEIDLGPGAHFEYYDMQESAAATDRYACIAVRQSADSTFRSNITTLRCGQTRNDIIVSLDGEGADCRLSGMATAGGMQVVDNSTLVVHNAPHCHSDQLFKYVADDEARCAFEGLIKVQPGAHHTEAYQNNRNILASKGARMHTRPQLEIYCDDVKANHGAATGQLDEEALFYMRTRGIPVDEARTMLMQAFMVDVIDSIMLLPLRERMRQLVSRRFGSPGDMCAACSPEVEP